MAEGQVLQAMSQVQEFRAVAVQLAGQWGGRDTLGDPTDDQDQFAGPAPDAVEGRAGEGVEDPATVIASEVQDRGAMTAVDHHPVATVAARTGQAAGMQPRDERGGAGLLVPQGGDREIPGQLRSRALGSGSPEYQTERPWM